MPTDLSEDEVLLFSPRRLEHTACKTRKETLSPVQDTPNSMPALFTYDEGPTTSQMQAHCEAQKVARLTLIIGLKNVVLDCSRSFTIFIPRYARCVRFG